MAELRAEMTTGFAELRSDLKQQIGGVQTDLKQQIAGVQAELIKWTFLFWLGTIGTVVLLLPVLRPGVSLRRFGADRGFRCALRGHLPIHRVALIEQPIKRHQRDVRGLSDRAEFQRAPQCGFNPLARVRAA